MLFEEFCSSKTLKYPVQRYLWRFFLSTKQVKIASATYVVLGVGSSKTPKYPVQRYIWRFFLSRNQLKIASAIYFLVMFGPT